MSGSAPWDAPRTRGQGGCSARKIRGSWFTGLVPLFRRALGRVKRRRLRRRRRQQRRRPPLQLPKHRHHHDDGILSYHRSDDEAKPRRPYAPSSFPSSPASPTTTHRLLLFAVVCLLLAVASLAFAASVSRRPTPLQPAPASVALRCGRAEDSLRSFLVASSRNYSAGDRDKVLAVVGVHTELGSAACRAALRATWFPPNPEGIVS